MTKTIDTLSKAKHALDGLRHAQRTAIRDLSLPDAELHCDRSDLMIDAHRVAVGIAELRRTIRQFEAGKLKNGSLHPRDFCAECGHRTDGMLCRNGQVFCRDCFTC